MERQDQNIEIREVTSYLKYCSDNPQVISGVFERHEIRFTQPWGLNDPLEFNPIVRFNNDEGVHDTYRLNGITMPSRHFVAEFDVIHNQINNYGLLSLTKIGDSFEMWSRYANGHKGFLVEFKDDFCKFPCMKSKEGTEYPVRRVEYVNDYIFNMDDSLDEDGKIFKENREELFYTKTSRWNHEREYRVVRPLSDSLNYSPRQIRAGERDESVYLFNFSLDCIQSITFGAYMSIDNKQKIISCCKRSNIAFFQAIISKAEKDRYGNPAVMRYEQIEKIPGFPNIEPMIFCYDINTSNRKCVDINDISKLPYYHGNEQWTKEYYDRRCSRIM